MSASDNAPSFRPTLTEALKAELSLDEMLADPIVRKVMKRDGVSEVELRNLMAHRGEHRAA